MKVGVLGMKVGVLGMKVGVLGMKVGGLGMKVGVPRMKVGVGPACRDRLVVTPAAEAAPLRGSTPPHSLWVSQEGGS